MTNIEAHHTINQLLFTNGTTRQAVSSTDPYAER